MEEEHAVLVRSRGGARPGVAVVDGGVASCQGASRGGRVLEATADLGHAYE